MKKLLAVFLFCSLLVVTGCTNNEEKELNCTKKDEISGVGTLESTYNLKAKDGYVTTLNTTESVTSSNASILESYKTTLEEVYKAYNDIEFYENDIKIEGDKLISTTKVNYAKVDTKKLIEIDENNKAAIEDGKIKASVLKEAYEKLGATCTTK